MIGLAHLKIYNPNDRQSQTTKYYKDSSGNIYRTGDSYYLSTSDNTMLSGTITEITQEEYEELDSSN